MFNQTNGEININRDLLLSPTFTISSDNTGNWKQFPTEKDDLHSVFSKDVIENSGSQLNITVTFIGQMLLAVDLSFFLSNEQKNRIHGENNNIRRQFHEQMLRTELGDTPYEYPWGCILLGTGERDGLSIIRVLYTASIKYDPNLKFSYTNNFNWI